MPSPTRSIRPKPPEAEADGPAMSGSALEVSSGKAPSRPAAFQLPTPTVSYTYHYVDHTYMHMRLQWRAVYLEFAALTTCGHF